MDNLPFLSDSFQDSFFSFNVVHSVHCCFTLLFWGLVLALTLILEVLAIISGRFLPLTFFLYFPLCNSYQMHCGTYCSACHFISSLLYFLSIFLCFHSRWFPQFHLPIHWLSLQLCLNIPWFLEFLFSSFYLFFKHIFYFFI